MSSVTTATETIFFHSLFSFCQSYFLGFYILSLHRDSSFCDIWIILNMVDVFKSLTSGLEALRFTHSNSNFAVIFGTYSLPYVTLSVLFCKDQLAQI